MPPRTVLLKPASGDCNLRCKYCFYHDEMHNRTCQSYGRMSLEVLESIISKTLAASDKQCTFCFQGGEPTLAGLDFFRSAMDMQKNMLAGMLQYSTHCKQTEHLLRKNGQSS